MSAGIASVNINAVSITADASGHTLNELSKLIQRRIEYTKETARHAIGGVAITALTSIRAATRKRRTGKRGFVNG